MSSHSQKWTADRAFIEGRGALLASFAACPPRPSQPYPLLRRYSHTLHLSPGELHILRALRKAAVSLNHFTARQAYLPPRRTQGRCDQDSYEVDSRGTAADELQDPVAQACAGVEARIGPLHQQCHLPDVQAGCGQLVALKTLRVFGSDFAEYDCVDDQDFDCGFDQSCSLYRMQPTRVVVIDMLVQAELCTYALFFRTARLPSITFVFRSLFESWEEVVKLDLIPCHLPSLDRQMPKSDRGGDRKALRILFAGVSGGEADVRELPEDEQEIWATATDCLSELLDSGVDIYLLADPDRRAIIHEDIYGVEEMLEIDYFNAELAKKAWGRLDPERGLLQRRADYLQLDDTADELDEATMDRLRQDEAAYRRRKAQGADAGGD